MEPIATVEQLGDFLGQTIANDSAAQLYLDIAAGMVRDYLHQELTYHIEDSVVLDPINGANVLLPELPVEKVTKLEVQIDGAWTTVDPTRYVVSAATGFVVGLPHSDIRWPFTSGTWRVTYTHGFQDVPDTIRGVVLGVAARGYASPVGVQQERVGNYQVRYAVESAGFSPIERAALARYVQARIA